MAEKEEQSVPSEAAEAEQEVTPWTVKAKDAKGIDYEKLISEDI